eukprot:TRINITY_DN2098_c0_g1_i2.p1 TRINITY_DN2098_c0_g1~~TRINITY_DN2098_c0_g1_i2.p1  ORF type:complete len:146 (+),score=12.67 TRINITY_DN2098_c0_g1_i2:38-439(+)
MTCFFRCTDLFCSIFFLYPRHQNSKQRMGNLFQRLFDLFGPTSGRILMIGLDSAGKTTTLYNFKMGEVVTTTPTIGFNVESLVYKNVNLTVWDIGGQDKIRVLWRHYYTNTTGLIFVVDSNDHERIDEGLSFL